MSDVMWRMKGLGEWVRVDAEVQTAKRPRRRGVAHDVPSDSVRLTYRVDEVAGLIGLGVTRTRELVAKGQIKSVRIGRRLLVPADAVQQFIASLPAEDARGSVRIKP